MDLCIVCDKPNARACDRCKCARYCTKACQKEDWPIHKLLCAEFSTFDISKRPSKNHTRAILFPVDGKKPEVVWLQHSWVDDGGPAQKAELQPYFEPDYPTAIPIRYNYRTLKDLSDTIWVSYLDNFMNDGSKINKSIERILDTKPGQHHYWRGPAVAHGVVGSEDDRIARDLDLIDFRRIADCFFAYDPKPTRSNDRPTNTKIKGVRLNCVGDQDSCGRPQYEAVELDSTDLIFSKHDKSEIADRIGIPIFTRRLTPDPSWADDQDVRKSRLFGPYHNAEAEKLHLCCDPKAQPDRHTGSMGWGQAPQQWQSKTGSVLIVRQDKQPLLPSIAEALCMYCFCDVHPLLRHSAGEYYPEEPMSKDAVLNMICRPTFIISWYKLMEKKAQKGESMGPYPYKNTGCEEMDMLSDLLRFTTSQ